MPKVKKIRAAALSHQVRQEPLGQVIEGDNLRGKYAAPIRTRRKQKHQQQQDDHQQEGGVDSEYLDAKTSRKILQLSADQEREIQAEERRDFQQRRRQQQQQNRPQRSQPSTFDSDEDEDDEEEIEEIILDEGEE